MIWSRSFNSVGSQTHPVIISPVLDVHLEQTFKQLAGAPCCFHDLWFVDLL